MRGALPMISRSLLLALSVALPVTLPVALAGCLADADLSGTGYLCESAGECAPGLICAAGRCAYADAGVEADAGHEKAPNEVVRLKHPTAGSQLLTLDPAEVRNALDAGYISDGVVFTASPTASDALVPIYELRHETTLDILFTASRGESDTAARDYGYSYRDVAFYAAPPNAPDLTAVHRFQRLGVHRYAIGESERQALIAANWDYEHVLFRVETR